MEAAAAEARICHAVEDVSQIYVTVPYRKAFVVERNSTSSAERWA